MIDAENNLYLEGYEITDLSGNVLCGRDGNPVQFLTMKDVREFIKDLKLEDKRIVVQKTIDKIPEG